MHKYFLLKTGMPRASLDINNKEISDFINTADGSAVNLVRGKQIMRFFVLRQRYIFPGTFQFDFLSGIFQFDLSTRHISVSGLHNMADHGTIGPRKVF